MSEKQWAVAMGAAQQEGEPQGYLWWTEVIPPGGSVWQQMQDGEWIVACYAPTEPPPPPEPPAIPDTSGSKAGTIGDKKWSLDWKYENGEFIVADLDVGISIDEELG